MAGAGRPSAGPQTRRRDRHGRGLRGPLTPPLSPISRTRAERFDDLVADEVRRIAARWGRELAQVEFAVEDVPEEPLPPDGPVPLGATLPGDGGRPVRVVIYRRPVEARATTERDRARLVRDLVVEEVADLLGMSPESVDPSYEE
ncbi:metallopeptidase family protein [Actinomadura harenae]|uniref:Metallopeptidase family protein n=1 Tax=Actinomadura harenae TaxID=2483351 RepID=A0A3M2MDJ0_9ACTN|nr:metallopeptidase family protein [Actinomadura harenae]